MTDTTARLKHGKMIFETTVDLESALKLKKGMNVDINDVIKERFVYSDLKKRMKSSNDELENAFGTTDLNSIVERMVKKGEVLVTQEFRDESLDARRKQIIDFLVKNSMDARTNRPYTPNIIESALKQSGVKIEDKPVDRQIKEVIEKLNKIIPIKIETKKIKIKIPAEHTARIYGILQEYKEKEEWLNDGSLEVIINIPVGIQSEFYDRLNSVTHGSAITSEVKEK